jgi:hypothetical protein
MADDTLQTDLADALRKRLAVIGDRALYAADPERHLAELRRASERITALEELLPANTHPQLRHYFERRSYDKALAWIEHEGLTASAR